MLQNLQKLLTFALGVILLSGATAYAGSCDDYIKEAEAIEGAVPKFDNSGKLRAIIVYGEGSFLTAKRSLVSKARRKAELKAKRAFSEWMKESLQSETLAADMMETEQVTNQDGKTQGTARELETQINVMRSNTEAVLSGLVKLDECVDPDEKVVLVQLGWKPSMSAAAADAKQTITSETKRGDRKARMIKKQVQPQKQTTRSSATGGTGNSLPGIKIIVVKVEGNGADLRRATNDGLRSAISQVFGEQFASETKTLDLAATVEATSATASKGVAVETSLSSDAVSSKTKGLIKSYRYLSKKNASTGLKVYLEVSLAKYESGADPNKIKAIVLRPKLSRSLRGSGGDMDVFKEAVQDTVESLLNQTRKITVLDRKFIRDQMQELNKIASGNSPISELARLGNTAGADIMVVSEIISYSQELVRKQLGTQTIERTVFNAEISVKVINVATTDILLSQRFPFRKLKIKASNPASNFGQKVGTRLARRVAGKLGGGMQAGATSSSSLKVDVGASEKRADKSYEKVKKGVKSEW